MSKTINSTNLGNEKSRVFSLPGKRLTLRVLSAEDISDEYVSWLNDYEIVRFTDQRFYKHNRENVIEYINEKYNSNVDLLFGIFLDHHHIGNIKLGPIDFNNKVSEISYFIGRKEMWGKGLMEQVICAVVDIAFNDVGLEKVVASTTATNMASVRVLEKCGFFVEGKRVKQALYEGERIDYILFGRLREDVTR